MKCVLILPYFGKFHNYFQLFLDSFSTNKSFDLLIFTDSDEEYRWPKNVKVVKYTLEKIKKSLETFVGYEICLNSAYKLCDYKPCYGIIFKEYIEEYDYWGHCDCDLLFGDLEKNIKPLLLSEEYDKLFAAGHLTIYRNTLDVNSLFTKRLNGEDIFRQAACSDRIYVFDEDFAKNNIHKIFKQEKKVIYEKDLSMNPTIQSSFFVRSYYSDIQNKFIWESKLPARYYWHNGKVFRIGIINEDLVMQEFSYIHLQNRVMRHKITSLSDNIIEILPDKFVTRDNLPYSKQQFRKYELMFPNLYWLNTYKKILKRKLKKLMRK